MHKEEGTRNWEVPRKYQVWTEFISTEGNPGVQPGEEVFRNICWGRKHQKQMTWNSTVSKKLLLLRERN